MNDLKYCIACLNSWHEFNIITKKLDINDAIKCLETKRNEAKEKKLSNIYYIVKVLDDIDITSENKIGESLTSVIPCYECGSMDIEFGDCNYTTFNVAWGKCKNCGHEVKISPCSCFINKDEIISKWNQENNPEKRCRLALEKIKEGEEEILKWLKNKF